MMNAYFWNNNTGQIAVNTIILIHQFGRNFMTFFLTEIIFFLPFSFFYNSLKYCDLLFFLSDNLKPTKFVNSNNTLKKSKMKQQYSIRNRILFRIVNSDDSIASGIGVGNCTVTLERLSVERNYLV